MSTFKDDYIDDKLPKGCPIEHSQPVEGSVDNSEGVVIDTHKKPEKEEDWDGVANHDIETLSQRLVSLELKVGEKGWDQNATDYTHKEKSAAVPDYNEDLIKNTKDVLVQHGNAELDTVIKNATMFSEGNDHAQSLVNLSRAIQVVSRRIFGADVNPVSGDELDNFAGSWKNTEVVSREMVTGSEIEDNIPDPDNYTMEDEHLVETAENQDATHPKNYDTKDTNQEAIAKLDWYLRILEDTVTNYNARNDIRSSNIESRVTRNEEVILEHDDKVFGPRDPETGEPLTNGSGQLIDRNGDVIPYPDNLTLEDVLKSFPVTYLVSLENGYLGSGWPESYDTLHADKTITIDPGQRLIKANLKMFGPGVYTANTVHLVATYDGTDHIIGTEYFIYGKSGDKGHGYYPFYDFSVVGLIDLATETDSKDVDLKLICYSGDGVSETPNSQSMVRASWEVLVHSVGNTADTGATPTVGTPNEEIPDAEDEDEEGGPLSPGVPLGEVPGLVAGLSLQAGGHVAPWNVNGNYPFGGVARLANNGPATNGGCYQVCQGRGSLYMITADGSICLTGYNENACLGIGSNTQSYGFFMHPNMVHSGMGVTTKAVQITTGSYYNTHVLLDDGTVWFAGENSEGAGGQGNSSLVKRFKKIDTLQNITAIYCSNAHDNGGRDQVYFRNTNSEIYVAGYNPLDDHLYPGLLAGNVTTPTLIADSYDAIAASGEGYGHAMGLRGGRVYTWGYLNVGDGNTLASNSNTRASSRTLIDNALHGNSDVVQILMGGSEGSVNKYILTADGKVYSHGGGHSNTMVSALGQGLTPGTVPGDVVTQFAEMDNLTDIVQITASRSGSYCTFYALKSDGTVWGCGWNGHGQINTTTTQYINSPEQIGGLSDIVKVMTWGISNVTGMVALDSDGGVWTRGYNASGHYLGNSEDLNSNSVGADFDGNGNVKAIDEGAIDIQVYGNLTPSNGYFHYLALLADGSISMWGVEYGYVFADTSNAHYETPQRKVVN